MMEEESGEVPGDERTNMKSKIKYYYLMGFHDFGLMVGGILD